MPPKKKEENLEGKIESILEKLDVICTGRSEDKRKLDEILKQTTVLQNELANLNTEVKKLQEGLSHADKNITYIQREMELKTSITDFEKLILMTQGRKARTNRSLGLSTVIFFIGKKRNISSKELQAF